jgi:hypothetical protein
MVLWEMWIQEKPTLDRCSEMSVEDVSQNATLDILNKTVAGYRPDLSKSGPMGHLNPTLLSLIVRKSSVVVVVVVVGNVPLYLNL